LTLTEIVLVFDAGGGPVCAATLPAQPAAAAPPSHRPPRGRATKKGTRGRVRAGTAETQSPSDRRPTCTCCRTQTAPRDLPPRRCGRHGRRPASVRPQVGPRVPGEDHATASRRRALSPRRDLGEKCEHRVEVRRCRGGSLASAEHGMTAALREDRDHWSRARLKRRGRLRLDLWAREFTELVGTPLHPFRRKSRRAASSCPTAELPITRWRVITAASAESGRTLINSRAAAPLRSAASACVPATSKPRDGSSSTERGLAVRSWWTIDRGIVTRLMMA